MVVPTRVLIKTDWVEQLTGVLTRCLLGQCGAGFVPRPSWSAGGGSGGRSDISCHKECGWSINPS